MTRSMTVTRRAALLAGTATVAALSLSGCGAGQDATTSNKEPSIYGVNTASPDNSVLIRGLAILYTSEQGYPAGGSAPVEVALFNDTPQPVTVRITSAPAAGAAAGPSVVSAQRVTISGAPSADASATGVPRDAEPSGSPEAAPPANPSEEPGGANSPEPDSPASPSARAGATPGAGAPGASPTAQPDVSAAPGPSRPAEVTIPALSSVIFLPGGDQTMQVNGLSGALRAGMAVNLVFQFSNGSQPLVVQAPVGVPATPLPRATPENEGVEGGYGEDNQNTGTR